MMEQNRVLIEEQCQSTGCVRPSDDPYRSCFGCENPNENVSQSPTKYHGYVDRQTGEEFQATNQSRRVLCSNAPGGGQRCRLRIDKAMQLRGVSYGRALQFIHSEQYLGMRMLTLSDD